MLIDEMHYRFDLEVDRVASQDRPDILPPEKDDYLNRAINIFVKDRYGFDNPKKEGFETSQERISSLMNLHIKSPELQTGLTPINLGNGLYEIRLSSLSYRYLFLTSAKVMIRKGQCVKTIDHTMWQIDDKKVRSIINKLPKNVRDEIGEANFEFCQNVQGNLRFRLMSNSNIWSGKLWNSINAKKLSNLNSVVTMNQEGLLYTYSNYILFFLPSMYSFWFPKSCFNIHVWSFINLEFIFIMNQIIK
jgi:hypothetical protein